MKSPGCQTLNSPFKPLCSLMDNDVSRFRVIPAFAVIFRLWWKGQLYSNVKYIYKYLKRDEICNVSPNALWMGMFLPDSWAKILGQLQETQQVSCWHPIFNTQSMGSWGCAVGTDAVSQNSCIYGCAHQLLNLGENECCKMEVNNVCFHGSQGHTYPSLCNENKF